MNAPLLYFKPAMKIRITEKNYLFGKICATWHTGGFSLTREGDKVFLCDVSLTDASDVLVSCNRTGERSDEHGLEQRIACKVKCRRGLAKHLQYLSIGNAPYIARSCRECQSITLYNIAGGGSNPITAYRLNLTQCALDVTTLSWLATDQKARKHWCFMSPPHSSPWKTGSLLM